MCFDHDVRVPLLNLGHGPNAADLFVPSRRTGIPCITLTLPLKCIQEDTEVSHKLLGIYRRPHPRHIGGGADEDDSASGNGKANSDPKENGREICQRCVFNLNESKFGP